MSPSRRVAIRAALFVFALTPFGTAQQAVAASTRDVDAAFDDAMKRYDLPGLAIGIVQDGKVVYARTGGEEIAGTGEKVTNETLFKIASVSKSMTTAVHPKISSSTC